MYSLRLFYFFEAGKEFQQNSVTWNCNRFIIQTLLKKSLSGFSAAMRYQNFTVHQNIFQNNISAQRDGLVDH